MLTARSHNCERWRSGRVREGAAVHSLLYTSRLLCGGVVRLADARKADAVDAPDVDVARIPSMGSAPDRQEQDREHCSHGTSDHGVSYFTTHW